MLGGWVENGEYPADEDALKRIVTGISYFNAKRYFSGGIDDKDKAISSFKSMARDRYGMFDE